MADKYPIWHIGWEWKLNNCYDCIHDDRERERERGREGDGVGGRERVFEQFKACKASYFLANDLTFWFNDFTV